MINTMRHFLGVTAVSVGVLCSLAIGVTYGYSLSTNPVIAFITAAFGFAAVAFELIGYHRTAELYDNGRYMASTMCLIGCIFASVINVTFDIGFLSTTFDGAKVANRTIANSRNDLELERTKIIADAPSYAGARGIEAIDADLTAIRFNPRWVSSASCTDATAPESIKLCASYAALIAERGRAESSTRGQERLKQIAAELSGKREVSVDDARAETLSGLTGYPKQIIETAIMMLLIVFLRFLTAMAPFVIWDRPASASDAPMPAWPEDLPTLAADDDALANDRRGAMSGEQMTAILEELLARTPVREPDAIESVDDIDETSEAGQGVAIDDSVSLFALDALVFTGGDEEVAASDVLSAYRSWCMENRISVQKLSHREFAMQIQEVITKLGGRKRKRSTIFYCGVKISPDFVSSVQSSNDACIIPMRGRASLGPTTNEVINRKTKTVDDKTPFGRVFKERST